MYRSQKKLGLLLRRNFPGPTMFQCLPWLVGFWTPCCSLGLNIKRSWPNICSFREESGALDCALCLSHLLWNICNTSNNFSMFADIWYLISRSFRKKQCLFNRILPNKKYEAEVHCSYLFLTRKNIFCAHFAKNVQVTLGNDSKQFHVAQTRMCTLFLLYNYNCNVAHRSRSG